MLFGSGVDRRGEVLDLGVQLGLVAKSGAWFHLSGLELPAAGEAGEGDTEEDGAEAAAAVAAVGEWPVMMGQGREKVRRGVGCLVYACVYERKRCGAAAGCNGDTKIVHTHTEQGVLGGAPRHVQGADAGGAGQAPDHGGARLCAFVSHISCCAALVETSLNRHTYTQPYAAHGAGSFHEEEKEEAPAKPTAAVEGAEEEEEKEEEEEDGMELENAREGALATPTAAEEQQEGKKAAPPTKGKKRRSSKATAAAAAAAVRDPEPMPVEHFGMGAGGDGSGGVDLEVDYLTGDVRNEAVLKKAAAGGGGEGGGASVSA